MLRLRINNNDESSIYAPSLEKFITITQACATVQLASLSQQHSKSPAQSRSDYANDRRSRIWCACSSSGRLGRRSSLDQLTTPNKYPESTITGTNCSQRAVYGAGLPLPTPWGQAIATISECIFVSDLQSSRPNRYKMWTPMRKGVPWKSTMPHSKS